MTARPKLHFDVKEWSGFLSDSAQCLLRNPYQALAALCAIQIVFWTVLPALVDTTPPTDVVEGYMWGREWLLMSYKHPQFSCWMLELTRVLTGSTRWPEYALSELSTCATFVIVYFFARDMMDSRRALASVVLLPTIFFFNSATQQYNHDLAQLPFWAAIVWALWRAVETNRPTWWIALGVAAGVGLHAKFSTGILIAFAAIWILQDRRARERLSTPWPWLGCLVFIVIGAPLVWALVEADFLPLTYAADRADWVSEHRSRLYFIGVQIAAHAGLFVALIYSGLLSLRAAKAARPTQVVDALDIDPRAFRYLVWFAVGPAALTMSGSLFFGMGEAWATPMFNLSGVLAIALLGGAMNDRALMRLAVVSVAVTIFMSTFYAANVWAARDVKGKIRNVLWPERAMSQRMDALWHDATRRPLKIVGGANWTAMVVGVTAKDLPSIFTDLDVTHAPWVTRARLAREGMLLLWRNGDKPDNLDPWLVGREVRQEKFVWSPKAPPLIIDYAIVAPDPQFQFPIAAVSQ